MTLPFASRIERDSDGFVIGLFVPSEPNAVWHWRRLTTKRRGRKLDGEARLAECALLREAAARVYAEARALAKVAAKLEASASLQRDRGAKLEANRKPRRKQAPLAQARAPR